MLTYFLCIFCGHKMKEHNHFCTEECKENHLNGPHKDCVMVLNWKVEQNSGEATAA